MYKGKILREQRLRISDDPEEWEGPTLQELILFESKVIERIRRRKESISW